VRPWAAGGSGADERGPGQFTVGLRSAGEAHIESAEGLVQAVRSKLRQHTGLGDRLVLVLDLSSTIISDREIAAADKLARSGRTVAVSLVGLPSSSISRPQCSDLAHWPTGTTITRSLIVCDQ